MAFSIDKRCLVCNALLTSSGQCLSCDVINEEVQSSVLENLDEHRDKLGKHEAEFQLAESGQSMTSPAFLFNKTTKERFQLAPAVSKIGRDRNNNIALPDDYYVSRYRAWVFQNKGKFWIEDIGSANGTLVNGHPITIRVQLSAGDRITFGKTELIFVVE